MLLATSLSLPPPAPIDSLFGLLTLYSLLSGCHLSESPRLWLGSSLLPSWPLTVKPSDAFLIASVLSVPEYWKALPTFAFVLEYDAASPKKNVFGGFDPNEPPAEPKLVGSSLVPYVELLTGPRPPPEDAYELPLSSYEPPLPPWPPPPAPVPEFDPPPPPPAGP